MVLKVQPRNLWVLRDVARWLALIKHIVCETLAKHGEYSWITPDPVLQQLSVGRRRDKQTKNQSFEQSFPTLCVHGPLGHTRHPSLFMHGEKGLGSSITCYYYETRAWRTKNTLLQSGNDIWVLQRNNLVCFIVISVFTRCPTLQFCFGIKYCSRSDFSYRAVI